MLDREIPYGDFNLETPKETRESKPVAPVDVNALAREMKWAIELEGESASRRKRGPNPRFHSQE